MPWYPQNFSVRSCAGQMSDYLKWEPWLMPQICLHCHHLPLQKNEGKVLKWEHKLPPLCTFSHWRFDHTRRSCHYIHRSHSQLGACQLFHRPPPGWRNQGRHQRCTLLSKKWAIIDFLLIGGRETHPNGNGCGGEAAEADTLLLRYLFQIEGTNATYNSNIFRHDGLPYAPIHASGHADARGPTWPDYRFVCMF